MKFSARTATPRVANSLADALSRARSAERPILDLTASNPTTAGLPYDGGRILAALGDSRALTYEPSPFGLESTRRAVCRLYAEAGVAIEPAHLALTASTSEAYAFLFKLLCDDGEEVLVPQPSYPLFELLAQFEGVKLAPYALSYDGRWHIDMSSVARAIGPRTRAIMMVSPNNPTGSYVSSAELAALARTGLPLVSDEVFAPFALSERAEPHPSALSSAGSLVFALSGLSKMAALPQMKLAWIAVAGQDREAVSEALGRLELLGDSFLSVSTPTQLAMPEMVAQRRVTIDAILRRTRANLRTLRARAKDTATTVLDVEGGWYATLRLPETDTEERWALAFLEDDDVYVHPGHFFDFPSAAHVIVSLLTPEASFDEGVARIVSRVDARSRV